ncbi:hypothetical protein GQ457_01G019280 [Hibiscus cannabinus]
MGKIARIDHNTNERRRGKFARIVVVVDLNKPLPLSIIIGGVRQHLEYEGLPTICFSCGMYGHLETSCKPRMSNEGTNKSIEIVDTSISTPEGKYGPWMQVKPRKKQRAATRKGVSIVVNVNHFAALRIEGEGTVVAGELVTNLDGHNGVQLAFGINQNGGKVVAKIGKQNWPKDLSKNNPNTTIGNGAVSGVVEHVVTPKTAARARGSLKSNVGLGDGNTRKRVKTIEVQEVDSTISDKRNTKQKEVASLRVVIQVPVTLSLTKHTAVKLRDQRLKSPYDNKRTTRAEGARLGPYEQCTKQQVQSANGDPNLFNLGEWIAETSSRMAVATSSCGVATEGVSDEIPVDKTSIQWHDNNAFDDDDDGGMVRVLDPEFNRYFRLFVRQHDHVIVALLETRISGKKVDHNILILESGLRRLQVEWQLQHLLVVWLLKGSVTRYRLIKLAFNGVITMPLMMMMMAWCGCWTLNLTEWIAETSSRMAVAASSCGVATEGVSDEIPVDKTRIQWHDKNAFDDDDGMVRELDPEFNRYFRLFIRQHDHANVLFGSIWLLWRDGDSVDVVALSDQFIHTICIDGRLGSQCVVIFVYASPNVMKRHGLWAQLRAFVLLVPMPWIIGGDFNAILCSSERLGGSAQ